MADPRSPGRMLRRSIATSRGVARLGPEATAVFCMIVPHLDSFGKMYGDPAVVKEVALPLAKWATLDVITKALRDITRHTNLKWWRDDDGRRYLHAINFEEHQDLRQDRRGGDHLPSFPANSPGVSPGLSPGVSPDLVRREVEVEVEVEGKKKGKKKLKSAGPSAPSEGAGAAALKPGTPAAPRSPAAPPPSPGNGDGARKEDFPPPSPSGLSQVPDEKKESVKSILADVRDGHLTRRSAHKTLVTDGELPDDVVQGLLDEVGA